MDTDRNPFGKLFRKTMNKLRSKRKYVSIEVVDMETIRRRYGEDEDGYTIWNNTGRSREGDNGK